MCLNLIWYVTLYTHNDFRASVYNAIVQLSGILTNAYPHILQSIPCNGKPLVLIIKP